MGRLELPRPLQALEPKCILAALFGTEPPFFLVLPKFKARRICSESRFHHADKLRIRAYLVRHLFVSKNKMDRQSLAGLRTALRLTACVEAACPALIIQ
jgi:hypothetical protein